MSKTKKAAGKELPADHVNAELPKPVEQQEEGFIPAEEENTVPSGNPVEENPETIEDNAEVRKYPLTEDEVHPADYESANTGLGAVAEQVFEDSPILDPNREGGYQFKATEEFIKENELEDDVYVGDTITITKDDLTTDELNVPNEELLSGLSFSAALNLMKSGKKVTRGHAAWDGRELYISGGVIYDKRPSDTQVYAWSCVQNDVLAEDYRVL